MLSSSTMPRLCFSVCPCVHPATPPAGYRPYTVHPLSLTCCPFFRTRNLSSVNHRSPPAVSTQRLVRALACFNGLYQPCTTDHSQTASFTRRKTAINSARSSCALPITQRVKISSLTSPFTHIHDPPSATRALYSYPALHVYRFKQAVSRALTAIPTPVLRFSYLYSLCNTTCQSTKSYHTHHTY